MTPEQHAEWTNWKKLVEELRKLGVEINDQDELNVRIKTWGESLVLLRIRHGIRIA